MESFIVRSRTHSRGDDEEPATKIDMEPSCYCATLRGYSLGSLGPLHPRLNQIALDLPEALSAGREHAASLPSAGGSIHGGSNSQCKRQSRQQSQQQSQHQSQATSSAGHGKEGWPNPHARNGQALAACLLKLPFAREKILGPARQTDGSANKLCQAANPPQSTNRRMTFKSWMGL